MSEPVFIVCGCLITFVIVANASLFLAALSARRLRDWRRCEVWLRRAEHVSYYTAASAGLGFVVGHFIGWW